METGDSGVLVTALPTGFLEYHLKKLVGRAEIYDKNTRGITGIVYLVDITCSDSLQLVAVESKKRIVQETVARRQARVQAFDNLARYLLFRFVPELHTSVHQAIVQSTRGRLLHQREASL